MGIRHVVLLAALAACAGVRTAAAAGGVITTLQATALLGSPTSDLYDSRSMVLRVRMSLHLGDDNADDGGGGPFTCKSIKNRFGEKLPCPGPKGRMDVNPIYAVPLGFPNPTGDGFLQRHVVSMRFDGGAECIADAYPIFRLGAAIDLAIPGPLVMVGNYVCSRDGVEFDRGVLNLWQQGHSRIRRIVP